MAENNVRFTLTVSGGMLKRAEALKKNLYYNKPYAEMYRQLIQIGMDALESEKKNSGHGKT